jgi:hypothetical protein
MIVSLHPWILHLLVQSERGQSQPFQPMKDLKMQWSRAFSRMCEVALTVSLRLSSCVSIGFTSHLIHKRSLSHFDAHYWLRG